MSPSNAEGMPSPARVSEVYDAYESTDSFFGLTGECLASWKVDYFADHFTNLLPHDRASTIVDIGCGQGESLSALRRLGYSNYRGIDISEGQLQIARRRFGLARSVEQGDAVSWLRERPGEIDCILAVDVLEHLSLDELIAMGESIRIALKPGGICLVQVPNSISPLNPIREGDITHYRAFSVRSLGQWFLLGGLRPISFNETPPRSHTLAGTVRRAAWKGALRPALRLLMLSMHGPTSETVFTANMIGVAEKRTESDLT